MKSKKIRVTGFNTPLVGVSFEYEKTLHAQVEKLITFLENRRVLYSLVAEKCPGGIIESIEKIRSEVEDLLENTPRDGSLFPLVSGMRDTVLEMLGYSCKGCVRPTSCRDCNIKDTGCVYGLLEFRKSMHRHIADLCSKYDVVPDEHLRQIRGEDGNDTHTYGICPRILPPE